MDKILYVIALILFLLAAFGVQMKVSPGWLGVAVLTLSLLI